MDIYFIDKTRLDYGYEPYEVAGERYFASNLNLPESVVREYFKGPGAQEKGYGWIAVYNGFTGFSKLIIQNGVARLYLTGECFSDGAPATIAGPMTLNLKQFSYVTAVKIYDQNGSTQNPDGMGDSIPACLKLP